VLCVVVASPAAFGAASATAAAADVLGPAESELRGKPGRELVDLRTRTSRTYVDAHETRTARSFASSVNYRAADGSWQAIDNTVTARAWVAQRARPVRRLVAGHAVERRGHPSSTVAHAAAPSTTRATS
jgi:hypothetical protein